MNARKVSLKRAQELKNETMDFVKYKNQKKQEEQELKIHYKKQKKKLLDYFNGDESSWNDYTWQMRNRITDVDTLKKFISLSEEEINDVRRLQATNRFAIVPYYLALIGTKENDPVKMLSVPSKGEYMADSGKDDPMAEEFTNPAGSITRRYPDRLIINVTNICAMYCRHCQRRRLIGETDHHTPRELIDESIEYVRHSEEIRDVLITGGDAFLLSNNEIEYIVSNLHEIPHVEMIRLGTRTPVTMPMRITDELVSMLKQYHPIYVNTHFNHPQELSEESKAACERLVDAGINVGNQAVLLKKINNNPYTMQYLNHKLLMARVRPYYIFHAKQVRGTKHFIPKLKEGLEIMEHLRGHTSGMAIPTYIFNAPGGLGKVPLLPEYIMKHEDNTYTIRTWENKLVTFKE